MVDANLIVVQDVEGLSAVMSSRKRAPASTSICERDVIECLALGVQMLALCGFVSSESDVLLRNMQVRSIVFGEHWRLHIL